MGFSYGTQLGSQYAELFPERVGRMVLDGILDHSQHEFDALITEASAFEDTFTSVAEWCNTTTECALYKRDILSIFDETVDKANKNPIPAPGCHELKGIHLADTAAAACRLDVTGYEIIETSQDLLSKKSQWPAWSKALLEAILGNATALSSPVATSNVLPMTESFNPFAHRAITCQDWLHPTGPRAGKAFLAMLRATRALAPHTRGISEMAGIQAGCIGWPVLVRNPQRQLRRDRLEKAPPIMLVNALHDPSTSVIWAIRLRQQMPTAVSIFRRGFGHTSYREYGETQKVMDDYLLYGKMVADLTTLDS